MITIKVDTSDLDRIARELDFSQRRLNAAIATTLTRTANQVAGQWRQQLEGKLDRPTPLTMRSVKVLRADARNLEAVVSLSDRAPSGRGIPPSEYVGTQEFGGRRGLKKFEQALQAKGAMPAGWRAVPGNAARLDAYGNVSRGQIVQVISQLGTNYSPGYQRVIKQAGSKRASRASGPARQYVAISQKSSTLKPGIYERKERGLSPVFFFIPITQYGKRLRLIEEGTKLANTVMQREAERAIAESYARLLARDKK